MKSPTKRPCERRPRECLQTACTAVSSSIAVSQNAIEGVQPDVGETSCLTIVRQVCDFPILKQVNDFPDFGTSKQVYPSLRQQANIF